MARLGDGAAASGAAGVGGVGGAGSAGGGEDVGLGASEPRAFGGWRFETSCLRICFVFSPVDFKGKPSLKICLAIPERLQQVEGKDGAMKRRLGATAMGLAQFSSARGYSDSWTFAGQAFWIINIP